MVGDAIEVFMDHFFIIGDSFDHCLNHLSEVLKRWEDCTLFLNWEMILHGKRGYCIGLSHHREGIEVDRAKVTVIERLPAPISV